MKTYENYIELSDAHLCWKLNNGNLSADEGETLYCNLLDDCAIQFRAIYGVHYCLLGRSGRHVCVENTPDNRRNYYRMKRTVERLQRWMVNEFNNTSKVA